MSAYQFENDPDFQLVLELQHGISPEENAVLLSELYRPRLARYFAKRGVPKRDREDLIQEVLARVFKSIGTYRREFFFSSWIFRIARNRHLNFVRHQRNHSPSGGLVSLESEESSEPGDPGDRARAFVTESSPLDVLLETEHREILHRRVTQLPPRSGRCLRLQLEGYTIGQIATLLQITPGAVKAHLHQAKLRLQKVLDE